MTLEPGLCFNSIGFLRNHSEVDIIEGILMGQVKLIGFVMAAGAKENSTEFKSPAVRILTFTVR